MPLRVYKEEYADIFKMVAKNKKNFRRALS
jgi:hypothetical protein